MLQTKEIWHTRQDDVELSKIPSNNFFKTIPKIFHFKKKLKIEKNHTTLFQNFKIDDYILFLNRWTSQRYAYNRP